MKILIIKTAPGEIDISKITYNHQEIGQAKAFLKAGHQCDVMCCAERETSVQNIVINESESITLYCVKSMVVLKNGILHDIDGILKQYDIIQASEYNQLYTWHLAKKCANKLVVYHGPYYSAFNKRYNLMAKVFDLIFLNRYKRLNTPFITKSGLAELYLKNKGLKNVKAIGVGVDVEVLSTKFVDKLEWIEEVKSNNDNKLLYIGRIEPRRNVLFLLDILDELNKKESVSLIMVGNGEDFYVKEFFDKAKQLQLNDKIIYKSSVEQKYMEQLYGCADIFLLPTIYDIYGMVLLEAMLFGKCVITTQNGGSNMMIKNGENGYILDDFSCLEWCETISKLWTNKDLRNSVSIQAIKTIKQMYTWDALVDKFLLVYKERGVK